MRNYRLPQSRDFFFIDLFFSFAAYANGSGEPHARSWQRHCLSLCSNSQAHSRLTKIYIYKLSLTSVLQLVELPCENLMLSHKVVFFPIPFLIAFSTVADENRAYDRRRFESLLAPVESVILSPGEIWSETKFTNK